MTAKTDDQLIDDFLAQPGIPINPELPANWDSTPHDARPDCHRKLWGRPYIVTWTPTEQEADLTAFKKHWPTGTRYTVRCLDGGSWDRSTNCGSFATAVEATEQAQQLPRDYSPRVIDILSTPPPQTPGETKITAKITITLTEAEPGIVELIRDGLDGDDLQWTEYGSRETLNVMFRDFLMERLSPDYDDLPAWYDDDWGFSVVIKGSDET